jgi:hypothetical protein
MSVCMYEYIFTSLAPEYLYRFYLYSIFKSLYLSQIYVRRVLALSRKKCGPFIWVPKLKMTIFLGMALTISVKHQCFMELMTK